MALATDDPPAQSPPRLQRRAQNLVFATVALGMLLAALDQTIVSTALPTIVGDLGSPGHQSWVITSYLLAQTVVTVVVGKFGDLFGRKHVFQVSIVVFTCGSALSGAAQSMAWLVGARAFQGLGAGGLTVTAIALIGDVIPLRERGRYQGMLGAVFGVTTVIGPLLGGLFTDHLSWRWAFYVNVPVAVIVVVLAATTVPALSGEERPRIDWLGIAFVALGASGLTLATSWGGTTYAWISPEVLGLFGASLASLAIFVAVELRAAEPVLPMRLFGGRVFSTCCALAFVVGFAMLGAITFLPTFLQYVDGVNATVSGLRTLPMVVGLLVTSTSAGTIVSKTGRYKAFPVVGTLVTAAGLFLLSRMDESASVVFESLAMLVLGAGIGLSMQVLTLVVQNTSSYEDLGVATSGVTFFRTLGGSFGASVFGSLYTNFLGSRLPDALRSGRVPTAVTRTPSALHRLGEQRIAPVVRAYADALQHVYLYAIPVSILGFALALSLKEVPLRGTAQASARDPGDGFGMPTQESSEHRLERAIAWLVRHRGREQLPSVMRHAGTRLGPAARWGLVETSLSARMTAGADVLDIARRHRLPPQVLEPTFALLAHDGLITRDGAKLSLTEAGQAEIAVVQHAFRRWLTDQLSDWDQPPGLDEVDGALDRMARRMLDHDPLDELQPEPARA